MHPVNVCISGQHDPLITQIVDAVFDIQRMLQESSPGTPLLLFAHSMGSFVAQAVDWIPELLFDIVKAAYHHKGLSFVRIVQRCPEWLPDLYDPWMQDPNRIQVLHHADGLQPSPGIAKIYKNQIEHDPMNLNRAREIASTQGDIPVGILYLNPSVPCYEETRGVDRIVTPEWTRSGLNAELDKYTVWPQEERRQAA